MHEVVTLQLGQRSNYVATHLESASNDGILAKRGSGPNLCIQESYFTYSENEESLVNHDVHFRAGIGADGTETFTPRTIIYDLKGGFGSLRKFNALYDLQDDSTPIRGLWDGPTSTRNDQSIEQTRYQKNLDQGLPTDQLHSSDVRYWSDFNRVFYHPRSIVQLNDYELNSQIQPFERWSAGEELYQSLDKEFDLFDRDFRPFAEECDQIQALQVIAGSDDAWGGFASKYVDALRDEFWKTCLWIWAVEDGKRTTRQKHLSRAGNAALSLRSIAQQSSAYIRLSTIPSALPSSISIEPNTEWITSGLLCSALESSTLPTRLNSPGGRQSFFAEFEAILNTNGAQNIFDLQARIAKEETAPQNGTEKIGSRPSDHVQHTKSAEASHDSNDRPSTFDIHFSPALDRRPKQEAVHVFGAVEIDRTLTNPGENWRGGLSSEGSERDGPRTRPLLKSSGQESSFHYLILFPIPFSRTCRRRSVVSVFERGIMSTSRMRDQILNLRDNASRTIDMEDREAVYNDLTRLGEGYIYGWDSGSDSGDED